MRHETSTRSQCCRFFIVTNDLFRFLLVLRRFFSIKSKFKGRTHQQLFAWRKVHPNRFRRRSNNFHFFISIWNKKWSVLIFATFRSSEISHQFGRRKRERLDRENSSNSKLNFIETENDSRVFVFEISVSWRLTFSLGQNSFCFPIGNCRRTSPSILKRSRSTTQSILLMMWNNRVRNYCQWM